MTERTTRTDLEAVVENLNKRLKGKHIQVQGRCGYYALDEYVDGIGCVRMVQMGTKKECYLAAWNMIRGIDLAKA